MERTLSGIKPTGPMTLGRYLGAVRHWVEDQPEGEAFYFIADLHALTTEQAPGAVVKRTLELATLLLAVGIDPTRGSVVFIQSHVPQHAEMCFLLECSTSFGELRRMTQFKDKSGEQDFVSAGLFSYPVLMAVDILLYDIARVPVGDDQRQHLELTRTIAQRFNSRYGPTFVLPEAVIPPVAARVRDLQDPTRKMSASSDSGAGVIDILDPLDGVVRKIRRAVTDTEAEVRYDPEAKPGVSNLLEILGACTGEKAGDLAGKYDTYGALKNDCAEAVVEVLRPIQQRYWELGEEGVMKTILRDGAAHATELAEAKLRLAKNNIGLYRP
ncbi:MAG: tryptophan--tRNA ligase [Pseudonocardiaceae bacterium]